MLIILIKYFPAPAVSRESGYPRGRGELRSDVLNAEESSLSGREVRAWIKGLSQESYAF